MLRLEIGRRRLVEVVPDHDHLVERGDVRGGEDGCQGGVEFIRATVGLNCDTVGNSRLVRNIRSYIPT